MTVRDVVCHQLNAISRKRCLMSFSPAPKLPCSRALLFISLALLLFCSPSVVHAGWVQQQSGTTASLSRVFFLDSQTGWACGGSCFVFLTTNGGQLWVQETVDPAIQSVDGLWFQNSSLGWVVGGWDNSGHMINQIYTTTDGGVNWQAIYRDTATILYSAIEFVTSLKGWLVGSKLYSNGTGQGYLFYTTDGGVNWALSDSSTSTAYWDISFADSLCGFLATGNPGMGQSSGFLKKTTNGGASWQAQSWGFDMFRRIHCLGRNHVWRSEYFQFDPNPPTWSVSKTDNGGATWQSTLFGGINAYYAPPVVVVDTLKTWVLGFDTLYGSKDGGKYWTRQVPPGFKQAIYFTDSLNGWIVGYNGLILHTTDGGSGVWQEPSSIFQPLTSNLSFSVVPNPFISFTSLPGHEVECFSLYDISGRRVGWGPTGVTGSGQMCPQGCTSSSERAGTASR